MRIAIIADTHLPRGARRIPDRCTERLAKADLIIHAGDIATRAVLAELEAIGPPLVAVCGNVDEPALATALPIETTIDADGAKIGVVHDSGPRGGRAARLRTRFPGCDAVIFGHSHMPQNEYYAQHDLHLFNPGSPTERRRAPHHTMGEANVSGGGLRFRLIELD